jgi:hypothetical protein
LQEELRQTYYSQKISPLPPWHYKNLLHHGNRFVLSSKMFLQGEMRQGLSYFHSTIFPALPVFYRRIDTALKQIGQPPLPLDHDLFK